MSRKEKKKLLKIRKVINAVENITLFMSFLGVAGIIFVIFLAPFIIKDGNYYGALFASIAFAFAAPTVAFIEDCILHPSSEDQD